MLHYPSYIQIGWIVKHWLTINIFLFKIQDYSSTSQGQRYRSRKAQQSRWEILWPIQREKGGTSNFVSTCSLKKSEIKDSLNVKFEFQNV